MDGNPANLPIVMVLGTGRSGTNLLANVIGSEHAFHNTVENRYIWNYRQKTLSYDIRGAEEATPKVAGFIRDFFQRHSDQWGALPVDKTPSNVFRIPFVNEVFPRAKFVHVVRDGRANIYSRMREWHGGNAVVTAQESDGSVVLRNDYRASLFNRRLMRVREMLSSESLPISRLPVFILDNLGPFLRQFVLRETVRYGERFPGMRDHLRAHGVLATAGAQWRDGVMEACVAGRRLGPERYLEVRYEDLLSRPAETWGQLAAFLEIDPEGPGCEMLRTVVRTNQSPDWRKREHAPFIDALEPFIRPVCEFLGYDWVEPDCESGAS